jgi:hypothetical protein
MSILENELRDFLIEAKKNTYASGEGSKVTPSRVGAKDLPYRRGNYSYLDSYFGEINFAGQEVVWLENSAIWGMNYFGVTLNPVEGFPTFLFDSLKRVTRDAPYRGPEQYTFKEFEYNCSWSGNLLLFFGEEKIIYKKEEIYRLTFHGGTIKYL